MFSYYKTKNQTKKQKDIGVDEYINNIKHLGDYQDLIINARLAKEQGDETEYKRLKNLAPLITSSCVIKQGAETKAYSNIEKLNGFIVLDIDGKDQVNKIDIEAVKNDPYVHILHKSFGGDGYVIFVKTNAKK